ncbi:eukaryotic translation initiation factor 3 subunit A-like [Aphis craccivora]|uniref:Eukaryotic translation initiation factor 3 subunit A-like n=1 Tax=Aphis craccivora TaxID=307492 RepID=A0A6G0ZDZ5_APHCR|nr:eukaryotic translation initiation factor 3 subunit A-like [Aphis craccivora]
MRPLPVLVPVLLACCVQWSLLPRCTASMVTDIEHPEPSFASRMELFEHVLLNDDRWLLVLKEKVRVDKVRVRYEVTENNKNVLDEHFRLVEEGLVETTALDVIQKLMDKCPWSGTCVNYTAFVLSRVKRVDATARKQIEVGSDKLDVMLDDVRMTFAVFMDNMAVVDGDLKVLSAGLYDYDSGDEESSDIVQINMLGALLTEVEKKLTEECHKTSEIEMIENMEQYYTAQTSDDSSLSTALTDFNNLVNCVIQIYDLLNVQTMPMETWIRVLEYRVPISKNINLFRDVNAFERTRENSISERLKAALEESKKEESKKHFLKTIGNILLLTSPLKVPNRFTFLLEIGLSFKIEALLLFQNVVTDTHTKKKNTSL